MDITTGQLRQVIHLKERIEFLQALLQRIRCNVPTKAKRKMGRPAVKRTISAAGRAKIASVQKARRATIKTK